MSGVSVLGGAVRPLLAADADEAALRLALGRGPVLCSPKIDGVRALCLGGRLVSRALKPIPNRWVQEATVGRWPGWLEGLDGELVVGRAAGEGVFARTSSGVMSRDGRPDFRWLVFDRVPLPGDEGRGFAWRHGGVLGLRSELPGWDDGPLRAVAHSEARSLGELAAYEAECVSRGFEGVMVRDPRGPYKAGRSTAREGILLKVKRFADREARVVGWLELFGNENEATTGLLGQTERSHRRAGMVPRGTLGSLVCVDLGGAWGGVSFCVGSGFDAATRAALWTERDALEGRIVCYRYQPVGSVDAPRFPVFKGFRHPADLS